ncbi:hypothetical protein Tco_1576109 [Tanacetum coccineum]
MTISFIFISRATTPSSTPNYPYHLPCCYCYGKAPTTQYLIIGSLVAKLNFKTSLRDLNCHATILLPIPRSHRYQQGIDYDESFSTGHVKTGATIRTVVSLARTPLFGLIHQLDMKNAFSS